ncbi:MAG TPA: nickel-responsive transcriptional regulator NikR [Xanthobacteraceae bacterium]|nr:nickel-responsive transcriptional regulator NikR [Xanthobacteraceae bacterium]
MFRMTITIDEELKAELDQIMQARGYQNRSEAIRDLARAGLRQAAEDLGETRYCVAALVYAFNHGTRALAKKLTQALHRHHDLSLGTLHIHVDEETCIEVNILKGRTSAIQGLADHVIAERGVRHGRIVTVPIDRPATSNAKKADDGHGQQSHRH